MFYKCFVYKEVVAISRKFYLFFTVVCLSIFLLFFLILELIKGNTQLIWACVIFVAYICYFIWITYEEYSICRIDKILGIKEEVLIYRGFFSTGGRCGIVSTNPALLSIKFERLDSEDRMVNLSGNLSNVKLIKGRCYKVSYTLGSKIIVNIKNVDI